VSHTNCGLAIFTLKKDLKKAKEEELLWKLNYISPCKKIYQSSKKKNPLKETKILQDIRTLYNN
jgi:hypothetical protein